MSVTHSPAPGAGDATETAEWSDPRPGRDVSLSLRGSSSDPGADQAMAVCCRSNSSPDLSIVCMMTASLRATATAARLKPIFAQFEAPTPETAVHAGACQDRDCGLVEQARSIGRHVSRCDRHSRFRRIGSGGSSGPAKLPTELATVQVVSGTSIAATNDIAVMAPITGDRTSAVGIVDGVAPLRASCRSSSAALNADAPPGLEQWQHDAGNRFLGRASTRCDTLNEATRRLLAARPGRRSS